MILVGGQVLYFVRRVDVCTTPLITTLMYVYLGLAYLWFFGPTLLLIMSAIFLPVVLIFLCIFGKSNQRPAKKVEYFFESKGIILNNRLTLRNCQLCHIH